MFLRHLSFAVGTPSSTCQVGTLSLSEVAFYHFCLWYVEDVYKFPKNHPENTLSFVYYHPKIIQNFQKSSRKSFEDGIFNKHRAFFFGKFFWVNQAANLVVQIKLPTCHRSKKIGHRLRTWAIPRWRCWGIFRDFRWWNFLPGKNMKKHKQPEMNPKTSWCFVERFFWITLGPRLGMKTWCSYIGRFFWMVMNCS